MAKYLDSNGLTTLWSKIKSYVNDHSGGTAPSDLADYIVERGTSGIWTYEKWNSGVAKCWGSQSFTTAKANTAWGNVYYATLTSTIIFPSGLFTAAPKLQLSIDSAGGRFWVTSANDTTATNVGTIYNIAPQQYTGNSSAILYLEAKGTWK